jgi:hypothetical protein
MKWIEARHLEIWADTIGSRTRLSDLVSALVRASASNINDFSFPKGDSAELAGYDGTLVAQGVPSYVPDGKSVWEFGTEKDYLKKANKDYESRTADALSASPSETTFVFVTPRTWRRKKPSLKAWQKAKTDEGKWKDVRAIDGVALEDWLEQCPAVAARAAREILSIMPANGARSTDEFWEEYSSSFKRPLTEQVLLCDREEQAEALRQRLLQGLPGAHLLQADSPDEALAFAVATIRCPDDNVRKFVEARTLVVDTDEAARQLARSPNLVFLIRRGDLGPSGLLASYSPAVVPLGRAGPMRGSATVLERPTAHSLAKALETMGYGAEEAMLLARKCGRSVTILARQIPSASARRPEWDGRQDLLPALLAGSWDAGSVEDCALISALAGTSSYAEYESKLLPYLQMDDPPLERAGKVWNVRAPVDAFAYLGCLVGTQHLQRLEGVFGQVFCEIDPLLDLTGEARLYAQVSGKTPKYSEWLRDGLATTVLLFAALHEEAGLVVPGGAQAFVDGLIKKLPGLSQNWRLVAGLQKELPLLMEAAPRALLDALEQLLEGDGSLIRPIFDETESALFPTSRHTGVLWALEVVAWDPEYLLRATLLLARLARIDPGGKLANGPIESLRHIFLPWLPSTNANLRERLAVLDHLINEEPLVAWKLVLALLPANYSVAQPTARPRYREAGASGWEARTNQTVWQGYSAALERALKLAGEDAGRWATLVDSLPTFDPAHFEQACDLLEQFSERAQADDRTIVWSALNALVNRNKAFRQAAWAMDASRIEHLERVLSCLRPAEPLVRVTWLFDEQFPMLPDVDPNTRLGNVDAARDEALREVYQSGGTAAILSLANQVAYPRIVAHSASKLLEAIDQFDLMIDSSLGHGPKLDEFALMLSAEAEGRFKQEWNSRLLSRLREKRCASEGAATLLLLWPDQPETWQFVASLGADVEESYWRLKQAWPLDGTAEAVEAAARKYVSFGRATAALGAASRAFDRISHQTLFEMLDRAVDEINSSPAQASNMFVYELGRVFDALDRRPEVPKIEIAKREYAYLPVLQYGNRGLTLHRMMAADPEFFVSVLCDVFKPASGDVPEPDEIARRRAAAGYSLLSRFSLMPGETDGLIDSDALNSWVTRVQGSAAQHDRSRIADEYIGHALAHSPKDADGAWPHRAVRDLIETLKSDAVESGIKVERLNMRGAFTKAMYEGGKQERGLAGETGGWAKAASSWPRTHAMLLDLARIWEAKADREDQRAEQDKMRFE